MNVPERRSFLTALAVLAAGGAFVRVREARAAADEFAPLVAKVTGGAPLNPGRVKLQIPRLADNGHSVPIRIAVDAATGGAERVRRIVVLSGRNPRPLIATFHLTPQCGRPEVATRVRLNGTQRVLAIAELGDGSYWSGAAEVEVTESACLDMP